jgi:Na+/H+-translocating membrane pyrophosphatase
MIIIIGSYFIFWNTFPDSVAVYNPFRAEIGLRGVTYKEAFWIFSLGYLVMITLIINSLWFTGPTSSAYKSMREFSKVSFSLNFLKSDYWAYIAAVMPSVVFFFVILVAFTYANAFGVSITYLGVITFYQIIQFFQNFKNIYFYYVGEDVADFRDPDGWQVQGY